MLLSELFEDSVKHVTFCFGRMNPPTIGHKQVLDTMKSQGGEIKIFVSQSQDAKKNPLDYSTKIKFIKAMFPEYAQDVVENSSLNTVVKVASYLYDQGYTAATFVAGSDRLDDMKKLLEAYNGVEGKSHGYYKFEVLDFSSSGDREDGAEGVAGVSASGARAAAANGDLEAFKEATGAGELSEKLYAAVRKGMGISESYKIAESVSIDSAIKNIVATGDSVAKTYGDLKTMAEKWVYNNGTLKGFHRNAAGVGKRWYDTFFWNKMENDLRTLLQKNPKAAAKIQDFLNIEKDDKGHVSFNIIGRSLPRILNDVGEKMGNDDLKRFGANWFKRQKDYEDYLGRVEKEVNDEEDDDDFSPAPKQPKDNVVGRQNAAAEDIVNQILKSIDKKAAGEIRNIIAREPNKLQALQKELAKRNIKVGESIRRIKEQILAELLELTTEFVKLNDGSFVQIQYRPMLNRQPMPGSVQISVADPRVIPNITTVRPLASAGAWQQDAINKAASSGQLKQKQSGQGVAEGIRVVDQDYDLDQIILTLDIEGRRASFTYTDYDENFENAERKDVFDQLQEKSWYKGLDHPTKMEILDAAYKAIRGEEPSEYKPTVGDEPLDIDEGVSEGDLEEDWRKKLAAAGMAGMMGLSGAAGAADRVPDTAKEPIIATVVIDGEARRLDLTPKGFDDVKEAERFLKKFLADRGIKDWQAKIERSKPGTGKYERLTISGMGGLESIHEAPIEMDPSDPMDPMIYGHDRANPGKLKYRMARAAGQLKDLSSRVDGASASEWQMMARQFEELKMNMEQIRHALEELGKVRKKGGIRSREITV